LKLFVKIVNDGFWLAFSDIGRTAGQFYWPDSTPVTTDWAKDEPNNFRTGSETCGELHTVGTKLYDYTCTYSRYTLCEFPPKNVDELEIIPV